MIVKIIVAAWLLVVAYMIVNGDDPGYLQHTRVLPVKAARNRSCPG